MKFSIAKAEFHHHKEIMGIAKQSKYTRDFSNHMFSNEEAYKKKWITVIHDENAKIIAFMCVRHKTRQPATSLYFIGVDEAYKGLGLGTKLIEHLKDECPHNCIQLNVMKDNSAGKFYEGLGFKVTGEALNGKGQSFELKW